MRLSKSTTLLVRIFFALFVTFQVFLPITSQAAETIAVDYSQVTVNQSKQTIFTQKINDLYHNLPKRMPVLYYDGLSNAVVASSNFISSTTNQVVLDKGDAIVAFYARAQRTLYLNSDLFNSSIEAQETEAHEMLHSYVPASNGYNDSYLNGHGPAFEEMLVEYYALEFYGNDAVRQESGYRHLLPIVPELENVIAAAGQTNPDTVVQRSLFRDGFEPIGTIIDSYLQQPGFFAKLGSYMDIRESKSNIPAALNYMKQVENDIRATRATQSKPVLPQVFVYSDQKSTTSLENISLDTSKGPATYTLYLNLSDVPAKDVQLAVDQQGALTLYFSGSNNLVFNKDNYSQRQALSITYPGGNKEGDRAELIFKNAAIQSKILSFSLGTTNASNTVVLSPSAPVASSTSPTGTISGTSTDASNGTTSTTTQNSSNSTGSKGFEVGLPLNGKKHYNSFAEYFTDMITLAIEVAVAVATLIMVYAGWLYSQSGGDAAKINTAKEFVAGSLTGLAILFLIRLILPTLNLQ